MAMMNGSRSQLQQPQYAKNETIYIRNLNEKLSKQELRTCLYLYFTQFGEILDIVAMKTQRMRGQAFIVFKDIRSATKAIDGASGVEFFGQPLEVHYAKTKSKKLLEHQGKTAQAMAISKKPNTYQYRNDKHPNQGHRSNQKHNKDQYSRLRIENVPINPNVDEMKKIFGKFPGFVHVIYDESKPGVCFVEYSNQNQSLIALNKLQALELGGSSLRITVDNFRKE
eukprot:CAMPEP_0197028718 /NCGR_PEP_ID=MMETSP1384-20130603/8333_1 /TAXON_ID=29189 /ORGANISM="Ammonia sp." /LENGTH=224 /DNA_ID=CAMNT_0042457759 /DNA_START=58 /DNA_END=732 /DNA_ORIENTATION=-